MYDAPLTEKQVVDYELRAAPSNPDRKIAMREQVQNQTDRKSIAVWLADGAKRAAEDNTTRSATEKRTDKDR